MEEVHT